MSADIGSPLARFLDRGRRPADGPIDWNAAPERYKRYPEAERVHLPWAEEGAEAASIRSLMGALLLELCGITRLMWIPVLDREGAPRPGEFKVQHGRSAPSGGALYPLEAYVAVGNPGPGLYHYDPAHHCLELLRTGDHRGALAPGAPVPAVVVLTTRFWRNGFKYGEFGYRLQTQEIGVLAAHGEAIAARLGTTVDTRLDFVDESVHALLDVDPRAEAALAMMFVGDEAAAASTPSYRELIDLAPASALRRAPTITDRLPAMAALHAASMTPPDDLVTESAPYPMESGRAVTLPSVRVSLDAGIPGRSSPADGFRPRSIDAAQLGGLIGTVADGWAGFGRGSALYCLVARVEGIAPGMYRYDPAQHALVEITVGVDESIRCHPVVGEAAAVLLPVGDFLAGTDTVGARWYRIVQADAGVVLQRGALAAAALGLAARIYSGESPDFTDYFGGMAGRTALAALLIGKPRAVSTLDHRIHPVRYPAGKTRAGSDLPE
ncbi:SagB family peptide dehydrogenase [Nocardia sp. NPDC051052]|uniref:SagB family peptide dehydrogenase n=1 Tax=Nocardia sp. NPDC051052 TaxID=3364322 RepID=UPI0037A8238C